MGNLIRKIEEFSINAQPCLQTNFYDGWILRFNEGYTKRANSVQAIYSSSIEIYNKISEIENMYFQKELPVVYKMTESVYPLNLDKVLEQQGYKQIDCTSVQVIDLLENKLLMEKENEAMISDELTEEWLQHYVKLNNLEQKYVNIIRTMLTNIIPNTCFIQLKEGEEIVACGLGVKEGKYVGLFDIVTHPEYRRKGYGEKLIYTILHWARKRGAEFGYLQVMLENKAAMNLYRKIGFDEKYQYWYRRKAKK